MVELDYNDWDLVVQTAEANIETIKKNQRRAEVGLLVEEIALKYAISERDVYPKPVTMEEEKKPEETPETPEEEKKE